MIFVTPSETASAGGCHRRRKSGVTPCHVSVKIVCPHPYLGTVVLKNTGVVKIKYYEYQALLDQTRPPIYPLLPLTLLFRIHFVGEEYFFSPTDDFWTNNSLQSVLF